MSGYGPLLDEVARDIAADEHDGVRFHFVSECVKRGIIPELPAHWFDEGRSAPFPVNWTASELTIFDNGMPNSPKKKARRIKTTKTQFGGKLKAWTTNKVSFSREAPWSHLISFFSPGVAVDAANQLVEEGCLDAATADRVRDAAAHDAMKGGALIGLLRRQSPKVGTVWLREHFVVLVMEDGQPSKAVISGHSIALVAELEDSDAANNPLTGRAVGQARLARNSSFDRWHNQDQLY